VARMTFSDNQLTAPRWAGQFFETEFLMPGGARVDASQFAGADAVTVTTTAIAAQNATSVAVTALAGPIPVGTVLYFGGAKVAQLTAAAATGATTLTVAALPTALASGDVATYLGAGRKTILSGTFLGRTITERTAGTGFGPWASGDDEAYLLAFDITDALINPDAVLVLHYFVVKENFLPGWSTLAGGTQTQIRALYQCITGIA
jgi:hypothetical protein